MWWYAGYKTVSPAPEVASTCANPEVTEGDFCQALVSQAVLTFLLADCHFPCSGPTTPPITESNAIRCGGGAISPHCYTAGLKGIEDYIKIQAKRAGLTCRQ